MRQFKIKTKNDLPRVYIRQNGQLCSMAVQPTNKIVKLSFSLGNRRRGEFGILCIISTSFRITKPPLTPLAMLAYSPLFTPACSTPWQRVGGSIIPLRASLLVFNRIIICIEIDDTNQSYGYRFCFRFFAHFTPCRLHSLTTGWGIDYHSSDILTGIY